MKNKNFPKATKSIAKAKLDLKEWGYCLLKDAVPTDLNDELSKRLVEQADAEKKLNLAYEDGSKEKKWGEFCLLYTSPSPRDRQKYRMPSSA